MKKSELRGERETKLREAVMTALTHMNSSNFGLALSCLHNAINIFDDYAKADFAAQDEKLRRLKKKQRRRHR